MLYVSEAEEKKFYMFDGDLDIALKCLVNLPYYFFLLELMTEEGRITFTATLKTMAWIVDYTENVTVRRVLLLLSSLLSLLLSKLSSSVNLITEYIKTYM